MAELQLPDAPEAIGPKKPRPWINYVVYLICTVITYEVTDYADRMKNKACNDEKVYLLKKLDSTNSSDMKWMRDQVREAAKTK